MATRIQLNRRCPPGEHSPQLLGRFFGFSIPLRCLAEVLIRFARCAFPLRMHLLVALCGTSIRRFSSWSYYRLGEYIEQKASPYDIPIVEVDPAYTSVTCSRCGERGTTHRRGVHFECESCGYEQHADANASVNIAKAAAREAGSQTVPKMASPK